MTDITEIMAGAMHAVMLSKEEGADKPEGWADEHPDHQQEFRNYARACLTALSEAGWVVVPRDPTDAMENAGTAAFYEAYTNRPIARHVWSAMVAAGRGET